MTKWINCIDAYFKYEEKVWDHKLTVNIRSENGLRYGTWQIGHLHGTVPTQAITSVNLEHAAIADQYDLNFGTKILEILEMEPSRLLNDSRYRNAKISEYHQIIINNRDKLCFLGLKDIKSNFRIDKQTNEFLIQFQINCGFKLIKVFFQKITNALADLQYFRNFVASKKKTFVACIDEKLGSKTFESLYLDCLTNKDDIVSFFGRKPNPDNADNFNLISYRKTDNILRFSTSISKSNKNMANSVAYNLMGFDCFSFSKKKPGKSQFGRLVALDGFYFDTLDSDTNLICVLTKENLYQASQQFKKYQDFAYLPIYIHDMVRLNQLLRKLHTSYSRRRLLSLFGDRVL